MANEIKIAGVSGLTQYVQVRSLSNQFLTGTTFEAYESAHWANYTIALTDDGTGLYQGNMPAIVAQLVVLVPYLQVGSSPTAGDLALDALTLYWNGSVLAALDLSQTIAAEDLTGKPTQTVGDCLSAARALAAGGASISGTTVRILGPNGETVRTFTTNSQAAPTQRI